MEHMSIPVLNVCSIFSPICPEDGHENSREKSAKALLSAFEEVGMAYLSFEGPAAAFLRTSVSPAFAEAKKFFGRPVKEKESAAADGLPKGVTRGYLGTGTESGAKHFELKEAFSWSFDWDSSETSPRTPLEARNVWPNSRDENKGADIGMKLRFDLLFDFMCEVMMKLVEAVSEIWPSEYKRLPDLKTLCMNGKPISLLRAFHYHGTKEPRTDMTGSCEHTDWGFATLIAQEVGSGSALQVFHNDEWLNVPALPDTLLVNCSDFLSMLTNGRLRSPLHRVVLTERERFSFVFFQYPDFNTPVPQLSEEGVRKTAGLSLLKDQSMQSSASANKTDGFADISFGEFIALKWEQVSRT